MEFVARTAPIETRKVCSYHGRVATSLDIASTYDYLDEFWRVSLADADDITCARYRGDFTKTLEIAQREKHEFILSSLRLREGHRLLDIGCGWGGLMREAVRRGITAHGLTLSPRQAHHCRSLGLDVELRSWSAITAEPAFDGIAAVGSFEHFCSEGDYRLGRQEEIYRQFFSVARAALRPRCRLYLQTMTWGRRMPQPERMSVTEPFGSDGFIVGALKQFYPGSWLPLGQEMIASTAAEWFRVISIESGRLDYIETIKQWNRRLLRPSLAKLRTGVRAACALLSEGPNRYKLLSIIRSYNRECFRREIMDHYRMVLECKE